MRETKRRKTAREEEGKANKTRPESGSGDQSADFGSFVYPEQDKEETREMKGDIDVGISCCETRNVGLLNFTFTIPVGD